MSGSHEDQARALAERIARRITENKGDARPSASKVEADEVGTELAEMRASLSELQQKLAHIESHLKREERASTDTSRRAQLNRTGEESLHEGSAQSAQTPVIRSPWLSGMYVPAAAHPSQERFGVEEAAVSELVDYFEREKTCNLEPGGKPCDHCAMCSSRGF
jgi:septal ring factor EnvC (AmiA/AmiB activator)